MDNKSTLKVSEHVGICQNLLDRQNLSESSEISEVSLKYLSILMESQEAL